MAEHLVAFEPDREKRAWQVCQADAFRNVVRLAQAAAPLRCRSHGNG
jgi:hypothetical protein